MMNSIAATMLLKKSDLYPYYGRGLKFDMFLEMATYMEKWLNQLDI